MNKHKTMNKPMNKPIRVIPRAMSPLANGEAAPTGAAVLAVNVREREQSLQVAGRPATVGAITAGDRLLLMTDGHRVTCAGSSIKVDNAIVATVGGTVVGAHAIGDIIVVVTSEGLTYLRPHDGNWTVLDPMAALPALTLTARTATATAVIAPYTFAAPYSQWRAPLSDDDTSALAALLRNAWTALSTDLVADGRHIAPLLARWGVRLHDDSYLWMSEPVRLGDATLANADRIAAAVDYGSDGFVGTQAATLAMTHYAVGIDVTSGISPEWLPLIKSIDVLVTSEAHLLTTSRTLDYRCITRSVAPREYVLEMGLSRRGASAITMELAGSPWHLVATAAASPHLDGTDFVPPSTPLTLTSSQCAAIGHLPSLQGVVGTTAAGGRLYCCTRGGDVVVSHPGNPLAEAHRRSVMGAVPLALAVVTRPLYSGGFGRYPVYVFSDDGIYAIPQSATGTLGEARLVDRTVIAAGVSPVEAWRDVWFVSRHGHLCRLSGAQVTVVQREVDYKALAWSGAHDELWLLPEHGYPQVMMASGAMSERTVDAEQLYSDPRHAVAVTDDGSLLDLEHELLALMPVTWRSHPVALDPLMASPVQRVVWHVSSPEAHLSLKLVGQRGIMAGDSDMSTVNVDGAIDPPLATPVVLWPVRTLRLSATGTALAGTLLLPAIIERASTNSMIKR